MNEEVLKKCEKCQKDFPDDFFKEKLPLVKAQIQWAKDIYFRGILKISCYCPSCNKKTKIGQLKGIYDSPVMIMKV